MACLQPKKAAIVGVCLVATELTIALRPDGRQPAGTPVTT